MKEMIKRVREEKGGFTLAELLIVVAIVLVLVAIAVPVYTGSLDSANTAVGKSAVRAVKGEAVAAYITDSSITNKTTEQKYTATVSQNGDVTGLTKGGGGTEIASNATDDKYKELGVDIADGGASVTVTIKGEDVSGSGSTTDNG